MRTTFHDLWGCARGPVRRLRPRTRILCGAGLLTACLVAPATTPAGAALVVTTAVGWITVCRLPIRVVRAASLMGLALFLPYFLLVPVIHAGSHPPPWNLADSLAAPWTILLKGMSGMLVTVATAASLSASELHEGLVGLPLPAIASQILVQIVHQTGTLIYETRRIAAAISMRGASSRGRTAIAILSTLPRVWLPRVIQQAERVAIAMEMRQYGGRLPALRTEKMRPADALALALLALWLCLAALARLRSAS